MRRSAGAVLFTFLTISLTTVLAACGGGNSFGVKSELVISADRAAAIAFAPDGRLFYGEKFTGAIRVISAEGELQEERFAQFEVATYADLDWGLTGLALDPDFETNHYVYAFLTEAVQPADPETPIGQPVIIRFTDEDGLGTAPKVIISDLPHTHSEHQGFNANGRIHFGPDGFLYISIGDYDTPEQAQDLSSPVGKLLRVDKEDGSPAPGNPLDDAEADLRIFAYGFREPFDFAFHPETGDIYGTDNTTVSCEEVNLIKPGDNYGWPDVGEFPYSDCQAGEGTKAVRLLAQEGMQPGDFLSFVVVSGVAFASGDVYPLLGDSLLVCESETELMRRLVLDAPVSDQATAEDVVVEDCKGDITVSPEGIIYYSNEDEIRRLIPEGTEP